MSICHLCDPWNSFPLDFPDPMAGQGDEDDWGGEDLNSMQVIGMLPTYRVFEFEKGLSRWEMEIQFPEVQEYQAQWDEDIVRIDP